MNKNKPVCALTILLLILSSAMAQDPGEIRNFLRVNKDFCTGGQPKLEHLEKLKADGVKSILNLRQPRRRRGSKSKRARAALLQHPRRLWKPKRRTGRRVSESHRRSRKPSYLYPLHCGHSRRRVLDDQTSAARRLED
jgi:hypothetical protein